MVTAKAGKPLIEIMKLCYNAKRPLILVARHGIGKSELLEQGAKSMGINYICRDLSLLEAPDLIGLPKITGKTTTYAPPAFLPQGGSGLLVFEELNRADRTVRAPCLQLLTARVLNDYRLPDGWLVAAAINPGDEGDYEVNELDPALLSRFCVVNVVADRKEWLVWAASHGVHADVVGYVESDPHVFDHPDSNPRSWKYVSDLLKAAEMDSTAIDTLRAAVVGQVGDTRGEAFIAWRNQIDRPLTPEEVLTDYSTQRSRVKKWIQSGRLDLVEATLTSLLTSLQPKDDYDAVRRSKKKWPNLASFFGDLPGDLKEMAQEMFDDRNYTFPEAA